MLTRFSTACIACLALTVASAVMADQRIHAPIPDTDVATNEFAKALAADADFLLIGAPREATPSGLNAGAAYIYQRVSGTYVQRARLVASDGANNDAFGAAVAISGDIAVVAAPLDNLATGSGAGSVYIFVRNGNTWSESAKLTAPDGATGDALGTGVAIVGQTVLAGAPFDNIDGVGVNVGSAHVFSRVAGSWQYRSRLLANNPTINSQFGIAVALSGTIAAVGARGVDESAGAVYVYGYNASSVNFEARLQASDRASFDVFGSALALSGASLVVGAKGKDNNTGAVYNFLRGATWFEQSRLRKSNLQAGDQFGSAVALLGNVALIGAPMARVGACCEQGAGSIFVRTASSWRGVLDLRASDAQGFDRLGSSAALSDAGPVLGAPDSNDPVTARDATGSAVVFAGGLVLFVDGFEAEAN